LGGEAGALFVLRLSQPLDVLQAICEANCGSAHSMNSAMCAGSARLPPKSNPTTENSMSLLTASTPPVQRGFLPRYHSAATGKPTVFLPRPGFWVRGAPFFQTTGSKYIWRWLRAPFHE
jgi:hypothetical protein